MYNKHVHRTSHNDLRCWLAASGPLVWPEAEGNCQLQTMWMSWHLDHNTFLFCCMRLDVLSMGKLAYKPPSDHIKITINNELVSHVLLWPFLNSTRQTVMSASDSHFESVYQAGATRSLMVVPTGNFHVIMYSTHTHTHTHMHGDMCE